MNPNSTTALLVMDMQQMFVKNFGDDAEHLARVAAAEATARAEDIPVIFVVVRFRPGHPEISPRNAVWSGVAKAGVLVESDEAAAIHPAVAPQDGEVVITKRRVGAFSGSDLEVVLRARGITRLVLAGIATSGVVVSTVRAAADLDFELVVLSDGCKDGDPEMHAVLTEKLFPRQASVVTVDEWASSLRANR